MTKDSQKFICVRHLMGKTRVVLAPKLVAILNGFSLCPSCVNEVMEHTMKQEAAQRAEMESHLKAQPTEKEAEVLKEIEVSGTESLVEKTDDAARANQQGETEPAAVVPEVQTDTPEPG